MRANMMQLDGPFSVPAPTANGGGFPHRMMGQFHMPQQHGGYDSSGINPHGMYSGAFGQPPMPHNPGGFQPMGLPQLMRFKQPSGLAALFAR